MSAVGERRALALRDYQLAAVEAAQRYVRDRKGRGPVIMAPTGSGKSVIAAQIALQAIAKGSRVLILTHRKELLVQNRAKLVAADPALEYESGYFSAGLNEKSLHHPIVFAGVQSLCRAPALPAFHVVIIDEAHRVPATEGKQDPGKEARTVGQYAACIRKIREGLGGKEPVWVGLTATPYRTGEGYLWEEGDSVFDGLAYEVDMVSLVDRGYLAPLRTVSPYNQIDVSKLKRVGGEFTASSLEEATSPLVHGIAEGALEQFDREKRRGMMVFTANLGLVSEFLEAFEAMDVEPRHVVHVQGDTAGPARERALRRFKSGEAHIIVSCGVLTEGFDAPHADMVVVARAMASPGLWVQVCGRGMRTDPGKVDCVVRDHGSNAERLGPVNAVTPVRFKRGGQRGEGGGGGGGGERSVKLSAAPSAGRMLVPGTDRPLSEAEMVWQRVVSADVQLATSKAGNRMLAFRVELEGKPSVVREHVVLGKRAGLKRYEHLVGAKMPRGPEYQALAAARKGLARLRRLVVGVEKGWARAAHCEHGAGVRSAGSEL